MSYYRKGDPQVVTGLEFAKGVLFIKARDTALLIDCMLAIDKELEKHGYKCK